MITGKICTNSKTKSGTPSWILEPLRPSLRVICAKLYRKLIPSHFRPRPPEMDSDNCCLWRIRSQMGGAYGTIFFWALRFIIGPAVAQCSNVTSKIGQKKLARPQFCVFRYENFSIDGRYQITKTGRKRFSSKYIDNFLSNFSCPPR